MFILQGHKIPNNGYLSYEYLTSLINQKIYFDLFAYF